jgi:hypothetical protein
MKGCDLKNVMPTIRHFPARGKHDLGLTPGRDLYRVPTIVAAFLQPYVSTTLSP